MPAVLINCLVLAALAAVVVLACRSLWKTRKSGGHCTGNCASCKGCHSAARKPSDT